jgi:ATP citrate (pro-S)-lyase
VDVEENWDAHVRTVHVPVEELTLSDARAAPLLATLAPERRPAVAAFLAAAYAAFLDCDFTLLEANPFTLDPKTGAAFPLDLRGELDDTAAFRSAKKWEGAEFPMPFGRDVSKAEAAVAALDESTGSSLKLTLLNPRGRIWTMVAGGGASVIYSDTVADLGFASELANYAEYSGGPSTAETYGFARELLGAATAAPDGRGRALIVGGGAAVMCSWGLFWL